MNDLGLKFCSDVMDLSECWDRDKKKKTLRNSFGSFITFLEGGFGCFWMRLSPQSPLHLLRQWLPVYRIYGPKEIPVIENISVRSVRVHRSNDVTWCLIWQQETCYTVSV